MAQARHIPQRTCVACRSTGPKRSLVRVVRTAEGAVEVDRTGKRNGRGAYLCARLECWEVALKQERLGRALRKPIAPKERAELLQYAQGLEPDAVPVGS